MLAVVIVLVVAMVMALVMVNEMAMVVVRDSYPNRNVTLNNRRPYPQ